MSEVEELGSEDTVGMPEKLEEEIEKKYLLKKLALSVSVATDTDFKNI